MPETTADNRNATEILDGFVENLRSVNPPVHTKAARDRALSRMANGDGYGALRSEVDNLKTSYMELRTEFHDLRNDMDNWRTALSTEIRGMGKDFIDRLDRMKNGEGKDVSKWVLGVATVALVIVGGFASLAKTNLDTNIVFTNEKIATQAGIVRDDFAVTDKALSKLTEVVSKMSESFIPRPELEYRINGNRESIKEITVVQDRHSVDIGKLQADAGNLKSDVERIKSDTVKRDDITSKFEEYQNRLNLFSNRLTDVAHASGGADVGDQIKQLRDQFNALQQSLIKSSAADK